MSDMVKLPGHHHPLLTDQRIKVLTPCSKCQFSVDNGKPNYCCKICDQWWHRDRDCMAKSSELVNHPFHPNHPLKLLVDGAPHYADDKCHFCQSPLQESVYHCFTCDFTLDVRCGDSPRPVTIGESKCHNHPLTLMARSQVSFVCNACGWRGERNPYVCVACSFMVHEDCVDLPHVININRHEHRLSHTYSLGPGNRICRVCRLEVDWMYGAYSCLKCPDFVVHSKCGVDLNVWDGEELEGVPEEEEDEPMFKVIEENVINHVTHPSHNLRLIDDGVVRESDVRCQLCQGPVYCDKFYSCMECDYILHETCAHLPKRKRHCLFTSPVLLEEASDQNWYFWCRFCQQFATGYKYVSGYYEIDLRCAALDWSCDHECHPHPLFLTTTYHDICGACNTMRMLVLRCVDCKFNLCTRCASYPKKVKHRCDDHPLVLSFGDKEQKGTHWCTVCEGKIDLQKWFYECEDCGIVCHIQCVLGDFSNGKPEIYTPTSGYLRGLVCGLVRNNGSTRPHCGVCGTRCLAPFIYSRFGQYSCSIACLEIRR